MKQRWILVALLFAVLVVGRRLEALDGAAASAQVVSHVVALERLDAKEAELIETLKGAPRAFRRELQSLRNLEALIETREAALLDAETEPSGDAKQQAEFKVEIRSLLRGYGFNSSGSTTRPRRRR